MQLIKFNFREFNFRKYFLDKIITEEFNLGITHSETSFVSESKAVSDRLISREPFHYQPA